MLLPKNQTIFHIPHSSSVIPDFTSFDQSLLQNEIELLTDWATDSIFSTPGVERVVTPFSRVFCDVERLPDDQEPMFQKGAGFYYTKTDSGQPLRRLDTKHKKLVWKTYYESHHKRLETLVAQKLLEHKEVFLIDCHSFSRIPLQREFDQSGERPDICLGTDSFHTTKDLFHHCLQHFQAAGFTVAENRPYSGTLVPIKYLHQEKRVQSIMIEINKGIYMDEAEREILPEKVALLKHLIDSLFKK